MNEFKGTPGPWFWDGVVLCNKDFIVGGGGHSFHNKANKDLIAAAPELPEALQLTEKAMVDGRNITYPEWYGVINKARAAIAKALGESK